MWVDLSCDEDFNGKVDHIVVERSTVDNGDVSPKAPSKVSFKEIALGAYSARL